MPLNPPPLLHPVTATVSAAAVATTAAVREAGRAGVAGGAAGCGRRGGRSSMDGPLVLLEQHQRAIHDVRGERRADPGEVGELYVRGCILSYFQLQALI